MGTDYVIFYTEATIICIVILLILLINDRIFKTQQEKQIWFNRVIFAFILYFISDACWAAVLGSVLPRTRFLIALFNLTNYILMGIMAYQWFMFMAASENMPFRNDRKKRIQCLLPLIISDLGIIIAYIAAPYFWIHEDGELSGLYYPVMVVVPVAYMLLAFIISVINARKADTMDTKKQYWLVGVIPLGVMAFGQFQTLGLNAPTFCFGCTIMLIFFYIQNMQMLISVDALTRLNNRGQINRQLEQIRYKDNVRVFAMMIDIDHFKRINDTYGHAEGDRALILAAKALKQTCGQIKVPVFLGRYGGDEFTLIITNPSENEFPDQVAGMLQANLSDEQQKNHLPYPLDISFGYDELRDENDTMHACLVRADNNLYEYKKKKGALR